MFLPRILRQHSLSAPSCCQIHVASVSVTSTFLSCKAKSYDILLKWAEAAVDALNLFLLNLVRFCRAAQKSQNQAAFLSLSSLLAATVVTYWSRKIFKRILFLSSDSKSLYRVESHILELDWVDLHFTFWTLHHPACASIYRSCPLTRRTFQIFPSIKSPGS